MSSVTASCWALCCAFRLFAKELHFVCLHYLQLSTLGDSKMAMMMLLMNRNRKKRALSAVHFGFVSTGDKHSAAYATDKNAFLPRRKASNIAFKINGRFVKKYVSKKWTFCLFPCRKNAVNMPHDNTATDGDRKN